MIRDAVRNAYVSTIGPPSREALFETVDRAIEVLKWDPERTGEGVALYATVGASDDPPENAMRDHRVEFYVGLLPANDNIASSLAAIAMYPSQQRVRVDHGDTVMAEEPLWPGTEMRRFLVLRSPVPTFAAVRLRDTHVEFLQVIPIYESEAKFKAQHGVDALIESWRSAGTAFWDPGRPPRLT